MRLLYVVLSWVAFLLLAPVLLLHRKTRAGLLQRFGFYPAASIPAGGWPRIWLHGASAGDLQALAPMMRRFRERYPECRILVSTITNTGFLMARERLSADLDTVLYAPWDLWGATRRALRALHPDLLVLEYTELWPNLIHAAHAAGARVVLTNGRFAPERLGAYRLLLALAGNPLRELDLLLMREDEEAERALSLGAPLERVWVTGNTKFDVLRLPPAPGGEDALRQALGLLPGDAGSHRRQYARGRGGAAVVRVPPPAGRTPRAEAGAGAALHRPLRPGGGPGPSRRLPRGAPQPGP